VTLPRVVDYSFARPAPDLIRSAGYHGVVRYLAPLPNAKVISAAEQAGLLAAGLSIVYVWEWYNQRAAIAGYIGGRNDAQEAIRQVRALSAPAGTCIYYVLEDPTRIPSSQWPQVFEYLRGVNEIHANTGYAIGGYGGQALVEASIQRNLCKYGWQVGGWSTGVSNLCHLYQRLGYVLNNTCDENACLQQDWGNWPRISPPPPPPPPPQGDDDEMALHIIKGDASPEWWVTDWMTKRYVGTPDEAAVIIWSTAVTGGKIEHDVNNGPNSYPQADVDRIPVAVGSPNELELHVVHATWVALGTLYGSAADATKEEIAKVVADQLGSVAADRVMSRLDFDAIANKVADIIASKNPPGSGNAPTHFTGTVNINAAP
jgi:hypothetical protein